MIGCGWEKQTTCNLEGYSEFLGRGPTRSGVHVLMDLSGDSTGSREGRLETTVQVIML